MAYKIKYKIVISNLITNKVIIKEFYKDNKEENDLLALDKIIATFDTKKDFINNFIECNDDTVYDVYICHNTKYGIKFNDINFNYKLKDEASIDKMINNIVNFGLIDYKFIEYIIKKDKNLYAKFDHYSNTVYEYNKLDNYCTYSNKGSAKKIEYKNKIIHYLKNNYNDLRKLIDLAYRYKDSNLEQFDSKRKMIDYSSISINNDIRGQLYLFSPEDEFIGDKLQVLPDELKTEQQENNDHLRENNIDISSVADSYFEVIEADKDFFDNYISNSNLSYKFKNYSNRYLKSSDDDYESMEEKMRDKRIVLNELEQKQNKKILLDILKIYVNDKRKKTRNNVK